MKNLLKYALIILISAGVFGCSSDNRKNEATEIPEVSVSAEQLAEEAGIILNLFDIELRHNLRQSPQHLAGFIQLRHIQAVQYYV